MFERMIEEKPVVALRAFKTILVSAEQYVKVSFIRIIGPKLFNLLSSFQVWW